MKPTFFDAYSDVDYNVDNYPHYYMEYNSEDHSNDDRGNFARPS